MRVLDALILAQNTDGLEEIVIGLVGAIESNLAVHI